MELTKGTPLKSLLPYNDPGCRAALYRALEKLVICPSPYWPAPLNYATTVFKNGLNDPNLEVSKVCAEGLVSMQSILRPRGPTLNLAVDVKKAGLAQQQVEQPLNAALPMAQRNGAETPPPEPPSLPPSLPVEPPPPPVPTQVDTVQIREPEDSPRRALPVSSAAADKEAMSTPPLGVTSLVRMEVTSPMAEERVMTRKEALKVIGIAQAPAIEAKSSPGSERKRPSEEPVTSPRHEKVFIWSFTSMKQGCVDV